MRRVLSLLLVLGQLIVAVLPIARAHAHDHGPGDAGHKDNSRQPHIHCGHILSDHHGHHHHHGEAGLDCHHHHDEGADDSDEADPASPGDEHDSDALYFPLAVAADQLPSTQSERLTIETFPWTTEAVTESIITSSDGYPGDRLLFDPGGGLGPVPVYLVTLRLLI